MTRRPAVIALATLLAACDAAPLDGAGSTSGTTGEAGLGSTEGARDSLTTSGTPAGGTSAASAGGSSDADPTTSGADPMLTGSSTGPVMASTGEVDGSSTGDVSESSSSTGHEPTLCEVYCDCVFDWCVELEGFPFTGGESCISTCESWSEPELQCFGYWCTEVQWNPLLEQHVCEHAWGELGLEKCG